MSRYVIRRPRSLKLPRRRGVYKTRPNACIYLHAYKCNLTADSNAQTRPPSGRTTRFCAYQTPPPPPIFYRFEACLPARFGLGASAGLAASLLAVAISAASSLCSVAPAAASAVSRLRLAVIRGLLPGSRPRFLGGAGVSVGVSFEGSFEGADGRARRRGSMGWSIGGPPVRSSSFSMRSSSRRRSLISRESVLIWHRVIGPRCCHRRPCGFRRL
jgi:hypothetical protein